MSKEEIIKIIDEELKAVDIKVGNSKANAYGVTLRENYAITLRDELNKLDGEYVSLVRVKNRILEVEDE